MEIYRILADHYDDIFEASGDEVDFLAGCLPDKSGSILDVACGTGQYSIELSFLGYKDISAIDIEPSMIGKARQKCSYIDFKTGSMLELKKYYTSDFDFIFCIGNSIAHLKNLDEIADFFQDVYDLLSPDSFFVVQIINFDRIFKGNITQLTPIIRDGLEFKRKYELSKGKVKFTGSLKTGLKLIESSVELTAPMHDEIIGMIEDTGFSVYSEYGSYLLAPYNKEKSFHYILKARK